MDIKLVIKVELEVLKETLYTILHYIKIKMDIVLLHYLKKRKLFIKKYTD